MNIGIKEPARCTVADPLDFRDMMMLGGEVMAAGVESAAAGGDA